MQEKILAYLSNKEDYISGDAISAKLGISRQALWKHIQELRDEGYDIVAVPHLGYRLESTPDKLFEFEVVRNLETKVLGKKVHYFEAVDSTMGVATKLAQENAPEGTIVLAETQTKGKGRLGRIWFSPKFKGIYMSLVLRPKFLPQTASILTLLTAVSICEAVKDFTGIEPQIKWPNDIFINGKKLGGILTELSAEMDKINFVVVGVGLNVNNEKKSLISGAVSLKEVLGEAVSRVSLLQEILKRIEVNYFSLSNKGSAAIIDKCRELSITLGRRVKVYCQNQHIEGEAQDIDSDGALLIRKDSGVIQRVTAGDVVHAR